MQKTVINASRALPRARKPCFSPWSSRSRPCIALRFRADSTTFRRGAKTVSTVTVKRLPQGALPKGPDGEADAVEGPQYPTVIQQALNNMRKFSHCILVTRVGSFYEMYFDQAEEYAPHLGLKLAQKRTSAGPVAMAGFPYFQIDRFLKILVQDMKKHVAISEEFSLDPSNRVKSGGLMFDRRVTRIVTPGTLIDEKFMNPWENNFILSIHQSGECQDRDGEQVTADLGVSWLDSSSGDFFIQQTNIASLSSVLARIGPREVVVDPDGKSEEIDAVLKDGQYNVSYHRSSHLDPRERWNRLVDDVGGLSLEKFSPVEIEAGSLILDYLSTQFQGNAPKLRPPLQRQKDEYMMIDKNSLKALEIRSTLREGSFEGSVLQAIRRTVTNSGNRLLLQRLTAPSTSLEEINGRLDIVTELLGNADLREEVRSLLRLTFDSWRLLQKFSFGRGDADDLLGLARTIQLTEKIKQLLHNATSTQASVSKTSDGADSIRQLLGRLSTEAPNAVAQDIIDAIDEEMLSEQHRLEDSESASVAERAENILSGAGESLKGIPKNVRARLGEAKEKDELRGDVWIMRPSASATLTKLHRELQRLFLEKDDLSRDLREKSGAQSLTLKWTPGLGHICHLKGRDSSRSLESLGNIRRVNSSKSTMSFYLPQWTQLGSRIDEAKQRIRSEEQRVFASLRDRVIRNLVVLRRNAAVLDELDVAGSFAALAREQRLVRPVLDYGTATHVVGGRHPTVEAGLRAQGRAFAANDCRVGGAAPRILLITGPNMGGKSTYLRQVALTTILAQTGGYVAAEYAALGIADAVFSRMGSADDVARDRSTFLVEMLETAAILRGATARSLVVMDEVGRGTTPEDGMAVGFAALRHLATVNRCRALFATHFHALADMTAGWACVARLCTDVVVEDEGGFYFSHKMREGVNRESHALKVARLAGLPEEAIGVAQQVLERLRSGAVMGDVPLPEVSLPAKSASSQ